MGAQKDKEKTTTHFSILFIRYFFLGGGGSKVQIMR